MKKILIVIILILGSCFAAALLECKDIRSKYLNAVETMKAYDSQLDTAKASNRVYKMTIDQLEHSMDSVFKESQTIRKQLKIKKKNMQSV